MEKEQFKKGETKKSSNKQENAKEKKQEEKLKNSGFIDAWKNAFNGIIYATTTQSNIKKQLIIAVIVVIVSLFFNLNRAEFLCFSIEVRLRRCLVGGLT